MILDTQNDKDCMESGHDWRIQGSHWDGRFLVSCWHSTWVRKVAAEEKLEPGDGAYTFVLSMKSVRFCGRKDWVFGGRRDCKWKVNDKDGFPKGRSLRPTQYSDYWLWRKDPRRYIVCNDNPDPPCNQD